MSPKLCGQVERVALRVALATPLFMIFFCLAATAGITPVAMRELALTAMACAALWCICVPRLAAMSHLLLFATAVIFAGLAFGLQRHGLVPDAALLIAAPQILLFATSLRHAREDLRERA